MSRPMSYGGSSGRTFRTNNPVPPLPQSAGLQSSTSNTFERDDVPLVKPVSSRRPSPKKSILARLGRFHAGVLILTTICIVASMGFMSFLWFANDNNPAWRDLASNNGVTRVVVIASLVITASVMSQAGVATSMLASLALEKSGTALPHLASVSMIRNTNAGPHALAYYLLRPSALRKGGPKIRLLTPVLLALLILTAFLSQFASFALLSDVSVGLVAGHPASDSLRTSLAPGSLGKTDTSTSPWLRKPTSYTAFADFMSKQQAITPSRVTDTGVSLRALIPLSDRQDRVSLKEYDGSATVLDTRVVCVSPDAAVDDTGNLAFLSVPQEVLQNHSAASGNSRLVQDLTSRALIPFSGLKILPDGNFTLNQISTQLSGSRLLSQFDPPSDNFDIRQSTFNQYIVTNVPFPFPNNTLPKPLGNPTQKIVGEWLHLVYENLPLTTSGSRPLIRISLCYNALSAVDMDIQASTDSTRNETVPQQSSSSALVLNFEAIRLQFGESGASPNDRGLLEMKFPKGVPEGPASETNSSDYIRRTAQWISQNQTSNIHLISLLPQGGGANQSHPDFALLFNEIMYNALAPNIGFAMQSMVTVLAQTVYQEQLPYFDKSTAVRLARLTHAPIPGGQEGVYGSVPAGFQPGYITVLVVIIIHLFLVAGIAYLFIFHTTLSTLNNAWQVLSQTNDALTSRYLTSSFASDTEVTRWMTEDKISHQIITITSKDDGRATGLKELRGRDGSANAMGEEGGLEISHWDDRLRGGYFHNANVRAGRGVPGRHPWQEVRQPWS
ncbi:hypothetical protein DL95DRAFT_500099 [Leptodontidium sp. 2 PMI_412]|nr:hypothetical protein DL95DRAFT_500099 [Leptodontidium sp. 2 PMI_412]